MRDFFLLPIKSFEAKLYSTGAHAENGDIHVNEIIKRSARLRRQQMSNKTGIYSAYSWMQMEPNLLMKKFRTTAPRVGDYNVMTPGRGRCRISNFAVRKFDLFGESCGDKRPVSSDIIRFGLDVIYDPFLIHCRPLLLVAARLRDYSASGKIKIWKKRRVEYGGGAKASYFTWQLILKIASTLRGFRTSDELFIIVWAFTKWPRFYETTLCVSNGAVF